MLSFRKAIEVPGDGWTELSPGEIVTGLTEDTDYLLSTGARPEARVFVDDVELRRESTSLLKWRPSFYAGRVAVDIVLPAEQRTRYFLDVSPSPSKAGQAEFDDMVADIRRFDQGLLGGVSAASMGFGHSGNPGKLAHDILLTRLREHGPVFLDAVEAIARSPHRSLAAEAKVLPLSRVRRLHHSALHDRRLAAMASGIAPTSDAMDSLQVSSQTSTPTFDTPANRAMLALLRRFRAALSSIQAKVRELKLGSPPEEQVLRMERRLEDLGHLDRRAHKLQFGPLFSEVASGETSAAGLTQIAAQPNYGRAYRIGCRSLSLAVEGRDLDDQLHVAPSWGIYETWCYLQVLKVVSTLTGAVGISTVAQSVSAERATSFELGDEAALEVLFQASFPALKARGNRSGWSISRERRPDIVLVLGRGNFEEFLVLDAKWRSGRENILDAMASAHIYHDALRLGQVRPRACLLLLPGRNTVAELETKQFIDAHNVGVVGDASVNGAGFVRLGAILDAWLTR